MQVYGHLSRPSPRAWGEWLDPVYHQQAGLVALITLSFQFPFPTRHSEASPCLSVASENHSVPGTLCPLHSSETFIWSTHLSTHEVIPHPLPTSRGTAPDHLRNAPPVPGPTRVPAPHPCSLHCVYLVLQPGPASPSHPRTRVSSRAPRPPWCVE